MDINLLKLLFVKNVFQKLVINLQVEVHKKVLVEWFIDKRTCHLQQKVFVQILL